MKFSLEPAHRNAIHAYGPGEINIGNRVYRQSLIVSPTQLLPDWSPRRPEELRAADIEQLLPLNPEIVILGTGAKLCFPSPAITRCLIENQIGLEVMDTTAACRTYNLLLGEGRRVVAGLMIIPSR